MGIPTQVTAHVGPPEPYPKNPPRPEMYALAMTINGVWCLCYPGSTKAQIDYFNRRHPGSQAVVIPSENDSNATIDKDAEIAALSFQVQRLVDMLNEADAANSAKGAKEIQMQGIAQLCQSNPIRCRNYCDDEGNPAGGYAHGPGMCISWQDGPRGVTQDGNLGPANGAFVEDALMAAHQRLDAFQRSKYAHPANAEAMRLIYEAMQALNMRAMERADRGVLWKNEV